MVKIFVDSREIPSRIPEALRELGAEIATGNLETGDYVSGSEPSGRAQDGCGFLRQHHR